MEIRQKIKMLLTILLVLVLHNTYFILHSVYAQEVNLSLSPPLVKMTIKPGKSVLIGYRLQNYGDPVIVNSYVLPFKPTGIEGGLLLSDKASGPLRFNLENADLQLNEAFFLKNKDSRQLLLKIRIPENTPEGDYYYSFLNETKSPQENDGETTSRAKATIGANILVTVSQSGQIDIRGKITKFDIIPRYRLGLFGKTINILESLDKIPVLLVVANEGDNLITAEGDIELRGNFGERAKYSILQENILSSSQRLLHATPSAEIKVSQPTTLILSGFFLGRYKLSTSVNFGPGTGALFAGTTFYALPIKFIFVLLIVIGISIFVIRRMKED